jgi:formate-dependent phosphoribosylglycinamide formyltransferase (GAR transformylase)
MSTPKKTKKPEAKKAAPTADKKPTEIKKGSHVDVEKLGKPMQTYSKSMAVVLTPAEKDARSKEAAKVYKTMDQLEFAKKAYSEEKNAEIKKHDARLKILMGAMETGKEDREIRVGSFPDRQTNQMLTVVLATGEVIERRTMSAEEKVASEPKKAGTVTKLSVVSDVPADGKKGGTYSEKKPEDKGPTSEAKAEDKAEKVEEEKDAWDE